MTKELWINLPVKDVKKSKEFFTRIGFKPETSHETADMTCVKVGEKNIAVLLFAEETLKGFMKNEISDTNVGPEAAKRLTKWQGKFGARAEMFLANRRKSKAGCMVSPLLIWTDIAGIKCLWIQAKCQRRKTFTRRNKPENIR
jgi:predicted enzyme related to lactoylglutathione lyase